MRNRWMGGLAAAWIALVVPAVGGASVARIAGLNVPGDFVKTDDTGMFTYLSEVNSAGNLAWIEAGSARQSFGDHGMGAVIPGLFGERYGVWSFNLRQMHPALGQGGPEDPVNTGGWDPDYANTGEAFDVLWGHKLGAGNLGLRFNRTFVSQDDGTDTQEGDGNYGRNILGFGAGYDFEMDEKTQIQMAGLYQLRSYEYSATDKSDGGNALLIAARALRKCGGNVHVIPAVKYYSFDNSYLSGTTTVTEKQSGWQAGAAGNWIVGTGDLLVFGAQVAGNKFEEPGDQEYSSTYMPNVFLALETHLTPWLAFRAGANNAMFYSYKHQFTGGEQKWKNHEFTFNIGTSVKLGSLMLDATLDPAFLQNPFAQLMGGSSAFYYVQWDDRSTGGSWGTLAFPQVSATYTW